MISHVIGRRKFRGSHVDRKGRLPIPKPDDALRILSAGMFHQARVSPVVSACGNYQALQMQVALRRLAEGLFSSAGKEEGAMLSGKTLDGGDVEMIELSKKNARAGFRLSGNCPKCLRGGLVLIAAGVRKSGRTRKRLFAACDQPGCGFKDEVQAELRGQRKMF